MWEKIIFAISYTYYYSQALLHHLNQLGEHLLSVSDMHFLQKHLTSARHRDSSAETAAWEEERKGLLDNIAALKSLLKQADQVGNKVRNSFLHSSVYLAPCFFYLARKCLMAVCFYFDICIQAVLVGE